MWLESSLTVQYGKDEWGSGREIKSFFSVAQAASPYIKCSWKRDEGSWEKCVGRGVKYNDC
jgi:hypothetical protein